MAGSEMRIRRISERDAEAILSGHAPAARPDLAPLADSITEFRAAAFELPAQPSADLTSRLGPLGGSRISSHTETQPTIGVSRERVTMFSWIAGLGLAAKIALAAGVAVAATAGAGAAGVLPTGAQDTFDTVVSTVVPGSHVDESTVPGTDDGSTAPDPVSTDHPDNFGSWVSERAKASDKVGSTFGKMVSEAAHNKVNGHAPSTEDRGNKKDSESSDDAVDGSDSGDAGGHGKTEGTPGKP